MQRSDRLVRRLYGIELISQQYSKTANSCVEVKPTSSKDFILFDFPKILSYKVPFGIPYLEEAWVNLILCVITEKIASCNCSCDHDGILDDFDPLPLLFVPGFLFFSGEREGEVEDLLLVLVVDITGIFFLLGVLGCIDGTTAFLDEVVIVVVRSREVQDVTRDVEVAFLQLLLLLFLISTLVEHRKKRKRKKSKT